MKVTIASKTEIAEGICAFELHPCDDAELPPFTAGAHIDVQLPTGVVRQYSLCNRPRERHRYLIAVLRDPNSRGGSMAMHALATGAVIEIGEPKNHFALQPAAKHSILLAGGIGVTPLLCMAQHLLDVDASFELHYCCRSPQRVAFRERLSDPDLYQRSRIYLDTAAVDERVDLSAILSSPSVDTHAYICGPAAFIHAVLDAALSMGWRDANLHREHFSAAAPAPASRNAFQVQIASTGQLIDVGTGQSIVAALAEAGIHVSVPCEQGVCGTCLTRVLAGEPAHHDLFLTEDEQRANNQILPCCSRSKSSLLVLDL